MKKFFLALVMVGTGAHFCFAQDSKECADLPEQYKMDCELKQMLVKWEAEEKAKATPKPEELEQQRRALAAGIELVDFKYHDEQSVSSKDGHSVIHENGAREDKDGLTTITFYEFSSCYQSYKGLIGLSGNNELTCYSYGVGPEDCVANHVFIYTIKGVAGKDFTFKHIGR